MDCPTKETSTEANAHRKLASHVRTSKPTTERDAAAPSSENSAAPYSFTRHITCAKMEDEDNQR